MKILSWYIARLFLRNWVFTLLGLTVFVLVANLFGNLDTVFTSRQALLDFADDTVRSLPVIFDILLPMTVLLATVFTFSALGRTSELIAMRSAGMGTARQLLPVFAVLVFVSALDYTNQNYFHRWLHADQSAAVRAVRRQEWQARDNRIYYLARADSRRERLDGVRVLTWRQSPMRLEAFERIGSVQRAGTGDWVLNDVVIRHRGLGDWPLKQVPRETLPGEALPNFFVPVVLDAHHMPLFDLYDKIRQLEMQGRRVELHVLEWYQKTAALFAPFVLVWFGAPLSQAHHRRGRASGDIMVSILGGLAFMIATEIFFTLGKGGFVGPVVATWSVNALFFAFGSVLMLRVR